jgi:hypothetical protein
VRRIDEDPSAGCQVRLILHVLCSTSIYTFSCKMDGREMSTYSTNWLVLKNSPPTLVDVRSRVSVLQICLSRC